VPKPGWAVLSVRRELLEKLKAKARKHGLSLQEYLEELMDLEDARRYLLENQGTVPVTVPHELGTVPLSPEELRLLIHEELSRLLEAIDDRLSRFAGELRELLELYGVD